MVLFFNESLYNCVHLFMDLERPFVIQGSFQILWLGIVTCFIGAILSRQSSIIVCNWLKARLTSVWCRIVQSIDKSMLFNSVIFVLLLIDLHVNSNGLLLSYF